MAKLYTKKVWVNDQTKLSAKNLNHIENGIEAVADEIDIIEENISGIGEEKQAKLVAGVNIQTINGKSILGPGNFAIEGHTHSNLEILDQINTPFTATIKQRLEDNIDSKSTVSVSFDGDATETVQYITVDGETYKLAGGSSIPDYYEKSNVSLDTLVNSGVYKVTNANKNPDKTSKDGILNVTKLSNGYVEQEWFSSTNTAIRILDPEDTGLLFYVNNRLVEQGIVHLAAGETYRLRGDLLGHVVIGDYESTVNNRTKIILEGVNIQSKDYISCIEYTPDAGKLVVEVADSSKNYLVVDVEGARSDDDPGALHSENNMLLNGIGYLTIINKKGHGIKASELVINGDIHMYLNTKHDAIHGGKLLRITNGYFEVEGANDAFSASDGKNNDGKLLILGGEYIIHNCMQAAFEGKSAKGIKRVANSKITFGEGVSQLFVANSAQSEQYEIKVFEFTTIINNTELPLPEFVSYRAAFGQPRITNLSTGESVDVSESEIEIAPQEGYGSAADKVEYYITGDFTGKRIITAPASGIKLDITVKDLYYETEEGFDETHPFWNHTGDKRLKLSIYENCLVNINKQQGDIFRSVKNLQIKGKGDLILCAPGGECLAAPGYIVIGGDGARYLMNSNYGITTNSLRFGEDPEDIDEKFADDPSKRGVSDTAIYVYDNYEGDINLIPNEDQLALYKNQIISTQYHTGIAILGHVTGADSAYQIIAQNGSVLQKEGNPYDNTALIYVENNEIAKNANVHIYIRPHWAIEIVPEIEDLTSAWTVYAGDGYSKEEVNENFVPRAEYDAVVNDLLARVKALEEGKPTSTDAEITEDNNLSLHHVEVDENNNLDLEDLATINEENSLIL